MPDTNKQRQARRAKQAAAREADETARGVTHHPAQRPPANHRWDEQAAAFVPIDSGSDVRHVVH